MTAFHSFDLKSAPLVDLNGNAFPTVVQTWDPGRPLKLPADGTHFGFVYGGETTLSMGGRAFSLGSGMYFAMPGAVEIYGGEGLVITAQDYRGFLHLGGPIERTGRLRYIDGCTDSLLIPPVTYGNPCLNLLHIPPATQQSAHTHPSVRVGLIVDGIGECVTPGGRFPLHPGLAFVIPEDALHSFHTSTDSLLVIAYHPDSDFGPTHDRHPMINRTILPVRADMEAHR